jgi:hypothetical protein
MKAMARVSWRSRRESEMSVMKATDVVGTGTIGNVPGAGFNGVFSS